MGKQYICQALFLFFALYKISLGVLYLLISNDLIEQVGDFKIQCSRIQQNWEQEVLYDVKIDIDPNGCKSGFGDNIRLITSYDWPGTVDLCVCNQHVSLGLCNEQKQNCQEYQSYPIINLNRWTVPNDGGNLESKGFSLCGLGLPRNFVKEAMEVQDCSSRGLKSCGTQKHDTQFCIQETEECPITDLIIVKNSQDEDAIHLDNNYYLEIHRNYNETLPLSQVRVTEWNVCIRNQEPNLTPGRKSYQFFKKKISTCYQLDETFKTIGIIDENDYYRVNNKVNYTTALYDYPIDKNYQWSNQFFYQIPKLDLEYNHYIPWKFQCRGDLFVLAYTMRSFFDDLQTKSERNQFISWILIALSFLILMWQEYTVYCIKKDGTIFFKCCCIIEQIGRLGLILFLDINLLIIVFQASVTIDGVNQIIDLNCSSSQINVSNYFLLISKSFFQEIGNYLQHQVLVKFSVCAIIGFLLIIVETLYIIKKYRQAGWEFVDQIIETLKEGQITIYTQQSAQQQQIGNVDIGLFPVDNLNHAQRQYVVGKTQLTLEDFNLNPQEEEQIGEAHVNNPQEQQQQNNVQ